MSTHASIMLTYKQTKAYLFLYLSSVLTRTASLNVHPERVNYCTLQCKDTFTDSIYANSACNCERGITCGENANILTLTDDEREKIVDLHNSLRERIANGSEDAGQNKGGATDMYALSYDYNLEHVAECWAKQCISNNDECRRTHQFPKVGQNFYTTSEELCDEDIFTKAIEAWYEEISGVTLGCVLGYGACISVGHYTQLVWAKTTHVGCTKIELSSKTCNVFCNYGPAGNAYGEALYTIGPPGKDCEALDKVYRSLCASKNLNMRAIEDGCSRLILNHKLLLLIPPMLSLFSFAII